VRAGIVSVALAMALIALTGGTGLAVGSEVESLRGLSECTSATGTDLAVIAREPLVPVVDASVMAGMPVTFSAHSAVPLTFLIASTPSVLPVRSDHESLPAPPGSHGIDKGAGIDQPSASGPPTYTFTSLNAGVVPRVLYWEVSPSHRKMSNIANLYQPSRAGSMPHLREC